MKCKSFHNSKSGIVQPIASEIGRANMCVCDQLPPAYPPEKEKVIFVGVEMNGKLPPAVENFCKDLNPTRTQNIAFYIVNSTGNAEGLDHIIEVMKAAGVNKVGDTKVFKIKGGLFKKGVPSQNDIDEAIAWSEQVCANL